MQKEFNKFNLTNLNEKQVDFYNFVINNLDDILELSIREISEKYGCGISFIYTFLNNIEINGWKTFIFRLGIIRGINNAIKISGNSESKDGEGNKISNLIFDNNKVSNFKNKLILDDQISKIENLCEDILKANKILGFGQGHGLLAVNDLFGMFSKMELKCAQLIKNKSNFKNIVSEIESQDLLIIYSFKGVSEFTIEFWNILKETNPELKTWLITSNLNCKIPEDKNRTIFIHNNLMDIELKNDMILSSPLSSFIVFNDYLKTFLLHKNKNKFLVSKSLMTELNSWKDNNNDYYRKENKKQ
ncbi:hypothetical protein [Spiroplasma endosymbiont of Panorpa germanica]|uniref:hypothetical protein n=1 Tax=Spiroplasma endosymbiont of Panorpa germanica TaxID=3066314 RepID=UPI0030D10D08